MLLDTPAVSNACGKALLVAAPVANQAPAPSPGGDGHAHTECMVAESTFRVQATEGL